jgi:hypothetical protein
MVAHANLTGANLHEPKGVASASADTVYAADGAGTGNWQKITTDNLDTTSIFGVNEDIIVFLYDDIGTAGSRYIPIPWDCTVVQIFTAIQASIAGADNIFTFRNNGAASMGTITVTQSGSAAGDVDSMTPASNNTFTAGQKMQIDSNGGDSGTTDVYISIRVLRTA